MADPDMTPDPDTIQEADANPHPDMTPDPDTIQDADANPELRRSSRADPLADGEYRALAEFRHALRVFLRFSEDAARDEGLTPNQHQLLLAVRAEHGAPGVSELAHRLQLKVHSTLELLRRAEAAGLVNLRSDPHDGRRQLVTLTREGATRLARLSEMHRDELRRFRAEAADLLAELG